MKKLEIGKNYLCVSGCLKGETFTILEDLNSDFYHGVSDQRPGRPEGISKFLMEHGKLVFEEVK